MEVDRETTRGLRRGQKTAFIAAGVTFLLAVAKGAIGHLFGSQILIADAFHSGADILAIFASGFGLWLASKKKSARFPYGLFKAETLVTLIVGIVILWAGWEILKGGYEKLFFLKEVQEFPFAPVSASLASIMAAFFIARKEQEIGEAIGSQSLLANAQESFLDIFTSVVVLIGILLAFFRIPYVEGIIIILISFLVVKLGVKNAWTALLALMDANLDPELQYEIEEKINELYGVKGKSEVKIRQSGPFKMVECKIQTSPTLALYRAHELAHKTENFIIKNYKNVESVFMHVEPSRKQVVSAIIPVKDMNGLGSKVHGHFGRAPYYIILKLTDGTPEIEDFYYNEFLHETKHIGIKVIKAVIKYKLDVLFTSRIGEISFYMLKENFVDIYRAEENSIVSDVIDKYLSKQIEKITAPTHPLEKSQSADG
ncbi:MAG: cation diffusion facilitator family transporter [Candidatus Omnitrophica bacterium]|nr:cation diffusion facilitator family transporter [Candidatus Omnitrophota bacterium]